MFTIPLLVAATALAAFLYGRWTRSEEVRTHFARKRSRLYQRESVRRAEYHRRWMADNGRLPPP